MWMFCIRFIGSNFLRKFKVPYLQNLVVNIRYSRIVEEYDINYKRLQERGKAYARWCDNIERSQWGARSLPILALVRATYYRLNELFMRKSTEAHQHKHAGVTYSEFATQWIETNMQRAGNIVVHQFDRRNEVFEVCEMPSGRMLVVYLAWRMCDCGHFQVEQLPCDHVIACCVIHDVRDLQGL
ncbi:hypothetical protein AHAS_Ahas16G0005100 [Arachis hypogaea]